jgi:transglutaminase-like putative cysteine protease
MSTVSGPGTGAAPDAAAGPGLPFVPAPGRARRPSDDGSRRIPLRPAEGWATIVLLAILVLPIAWSITDARWVLGRGELTSFLPLAALGGLACGILGAKAGWGRWTTHLVGAGFAGLIIPILAGSVVDPSADGIAGFFRTTASSTVEAILDLTVRNRTSTQQVGHYLLVLGVITWATAQFAGYAALGHRRPLGAVFVTGLVLVANMAITKNEQLPILVVFSLAALLLLVRLHADEERLSWVRRRIGDPSTVTGLHLRGGAVFVAVAVVGSLALTTAAASAPLAGAFAGIDDQLVDLGQSLQRYLPFGGPGTRLSGISFGPNATITGLWVNDTSPALAIQVAPGDTTPYYWKAVDYDSFLGTAWTISQNATERRDGGTSILDGTADEVPAPDKLRTKVTFSVSKLGWSGNAIFSPDAIDTVAQPTRLTVVGSGRHFGSLEAIGGWSTYSATALVPRLAAAGSADGFTANNLRVASTVYPTDIQAMYLRRAPSGSLGPYSQRLLAEIVKAASSAGGGDPYDLATAAVSVLHSSEFTYDTDVTDLAGRCGQLSTVECFAEYKRGYCQHYATTMAVLLRELRIPTRFVQGWLPGTRDVRTGTEEILLSNSHAWVEVYFPGYGWYPFDPTGNGQSQLPALPEGPKVSPAPLRSAAPRSTAGDNGPDRTIRPAGAGGTLDQRPGGPTGAAYVVIAVLLLVTVGGLAFLAYRRGPRGPTQPEAAWAGIARLAARFGWAPRPTQTPYEYAGALGDVLSAARPDLFVVADAKVEVRYGRRDLDAARLGLVRDAQQRLRIVLLRLVFRRPRRPRHPKIRGE